MAFAAAVGAALRGADHGPRRVLVVEQAPCEAEQLRARAAREVVERPALSGAESFEEAGVAEIHRCNECSCISLSPNE